MTNASPEQIAAKNASKSAAVANVARVAQGLPQIVRQVPKKVMSMADILKGANKAELPAPKADKQIVQLATPKMIQERCPELIAGLIQPDGSAHPGALVQTDMEGKFGPAGACYVVRFVRVNKPLAKLVIERYGMANRTSTKSRLTMYGRSIDAGIGGNVGPDGWNFVFNTAIFSVNSAGSVSGVDLEQHNGGHTCKTLLAAADPNAEILMLFCFGVPKQMRDLIDNNQARSAKDVASTRTELKDMFAVGSTIGGIVKITNEAMQTRCIGFVTQSITIVNNIRNGEMAKTGGNQGVDAEVLDKYADLVGNCVQGIFGLDSVCQHSAVAPKTGLPVVKTSGGLTKRFAINHLAAVQALVAGYIKPNGTLGYCETLGNQVLECYSLLANENESDATEPMVSLRMQIDAWDREKKWDGTSGRNVRFAALKMGVVAQIAGEKIQNSAWLLKLDSKTKGPNLSGLGYVDDTEIVCGVDDYVNPGDAALEEAGATATVNGDASLEELIQDDTLTEVGSDVPTDELEDV